MTCRLRLDCMHCSRLGGTVGLLLSATVAAAQPGTPDARLPSDPANWRMEQPVPGIHVFIAPDGVTPIVSGNTIVVVGDSAVLVVDPGQFPSMARQHIARIRQLTTKPVRYILNTHWHPDHWLGNGEFVRAFPEATVIATLHTREAMQSRAMPFVTAKNARETRDAVVKMVEAGKRPDGTAWSDIEQRYYRAALTQFQTYVGELDSARIVLPTVLFKDQITLALGGREVIVRFLGRGNTGGDAVVHVPDARTIITGDLLVHPFPYGIGVFVSEWIETMQRIRDLDATTIIPGHGAIQHDHVYLDQVTDLLRTLQSQVRAAVHDSLSLANTRKRVDLAAWRSRLCRDDTWCQFGFDGNFLRPALARAWREAKEGKLKDEG